MTLTLFSQNLLEIHKEKIKELLTKPFEETNFLYINTPGNYKPYKSKWMIEGEARWRDLFPKFQEFDIERAIRVDKNFDFKEFYKNYDYIFVSGGNTFILSYWMDKTGSRDILREMILNEKVIYGGESAGAVFSYKDLEIYGLADDVSKAPKKVIKGLDLIEFAPLPHWGNEEFQEKLEQVKSEFEKNSVEVITIADDQALFIDSDVRVVI